MTNFPFDKFCRYNIGQLFIDLFLIFHILQGEYGRGKPHCCTKTSRNNNVVAGVRELSPTSRGQVAAKILNEMRTNGLGQKGDNLDLPSGSKTLHIEFGQKAPAKQFSHEDMLRLKAQKNLSNEQRKAMGAAMRVAYGRKAVQPGLMEELPNNKFKLEDFFDVEVMDMVHKKGGNITTVQVPMLYSTDVGSLFMYLCMVRDLDPDNVIITLGLDDGQGSLKVNIALLYFFGIINNMTKIGEKVVFQIF